jgi:hypothetical protein
MQPSFSNVLRRNKERGAKQFLIRMAVPAAPFALFVSSRMGVKNDYTLSARSWLVLRVTVTPTAAKRRGAREFREAHRRS